MDDQRHEPAFARTGADTTSRGRGGRLAGMLAAAGVAGSVLASACCILPLALFSLGIGGAWISTLTGLAPYQPLFLALAALLVGGGFISMRRQRLACDVDGYCARPVSRYVTLAALWVAVAVLVAVVLWPWLVPILMGA